MASAWPMDKLPEGCRECGSTERRHYGRGLCSRCYQRDEIRDKWTNQEETRDGMATDQDELEDLVDLDKIDNRSRGVDGGSVGKDPLAPPVAGSHDAGSPTTAERRPGVASSPPGPAQGSSEEPAPRGIRKIFSKRAKPPPAPSQQKTKERPPKVSRAAGRRVSGAETLSDMWGGIGSLAIRTGQHAPLGRVMQFQAPVAGEMLDEAAKGSFIDKTVIQPVVKTRGRFDLLGAVFGPPLIVLAIERDPSKAEMLIPVLKSSIRSSLPLMVPAIKKVREREAKAAEAARDLFPDLPEGVDPVDSIIQEIFADWIPTPREPEPAEEPTPQQEGVPYV